MGDALEILPRHPQVSSEVGTDAAMLERNQLDEGEKRGVNGGEGGSWEPISPWRCCRGVQCAGPHWALVAPLSLALQGLLRLHWCPA